MTNMCDASSWLIRARHEENDRKRFIMLLNCSMVGKELITDYMKKLSRIRKIKKTNN